MAFGRLPMWPFCGPSIPAWLLGISAYIGFLCAECITALGVGDGAVGALDRHAAQLRFPLLGAEIEVSVN